MTDRQIDALVVAIEKVVDRLEDVALSLDTIEHNLASITTEDGIYVVPSKPGQMVNIRYEQFEQFVAQIPDDMD